MKTVQQELLESESRRNEVEGEIKRLSQILGQRQEVEQDLQSKVHRSASKVFFIYGRLLIYHD